MYKQLEDKINLILQSKDVTITINSIDLWMELFGTLYCGGGSFGNAKVEKGFQTPTRCPECGRWGMDKAFYDDEKGN